jgi:hypothetical protein
MPAMQESHLHLEIAHVLFMDVVGYSKLLVNEEREVMQQINSPARQHLAMGSSTQSRQSCVKGPASRDTAEIPLWRGDLLIEEVLNVKDSIPILPDNFCAANL